MGKNQRKLTKSGNSSKRNQKTVIHRNNRHKQKNFFNKMKDEDDYDNINLDGLYTIKPNQCI